MCGNLPSREGVETLVHWTIPVLALAWAASAQQSPEVTLTLAAQGGRTQFRMGEQIDVELRFAAAKPGKYWLSSAGIDRRYVRQPEFDSFTTDPRDAAADPLYDSGTLMNAGVGRLFGRLPLTSARVPGIVNDWISLRKPGRYRIVAHSTRVVAGDGAPVPLHSNAIDIEIIAADPEWRSRQLQDALTALAGDPGAEESLRKAARTLRFLETREAVPHLVRLFENGPPAAQQDLRAGLLASPHRDDVIAAMEHAIEAPGFSITAYWIGTLMQIEYSRRYGPRDPMPQNDAEAFRRWMEADKRYMERFQPIQDVYNAKLAAAVSQKQGPARAVSLETLLTGSAHAAQPAVRKALVSDFAILPPDVQWRLLMQWQQIGGVDLEPALRIIAARPGQARDVALERLLELNPAAARQIIIDRLRAGDLGDPRGQEPRAWLLLPDKELPEVEGVLAGSLDTNPAAATLLARYATMAVLPQVLALLDRNPQAICHTALSAYLFRVDPGAAHLRLARAREQGPCALHISQYAAALLISPALERTAIADLTNPDPMVRRSAQSILQYGGSAAAEQPLWDAFSQLRGRPLAPLEDGVEVGFVDALIKSYGWVLTPERLEALASNCVTERCRDFARSERRWLDRPIRITIGPEGPWSVMVGGAQTYTQQQTRDKLRQFARTTKFQLPPGKRFQTRCDELRTMLADAGMSIVH